jgi:hypothetical protein
MKKVILGSIIIAIWGVFEKKAQPAELVNERTA